MIPAFGPLTEELLAVPACLGRRRSLGVPNQRPVWVILRTAMSGIVTACLLAVARAAGETAPLLFTALNNQHWNVDPRAPTAF
jgi:phosphate transport system permease protein